MRLSSTTIFENGVNSMLARQSELAKTQNQISTGRRVLTPSDDPVAASQALDLTEAKGINKQYSDNAAAVTARLALQETSLSAMTRLLQDVKTLTVQAGDGALNASDLRSIADEIDGRYRELLGLANATDGNGEYLFAGYRTRTTPFEETAPGVVVYLGDEGRREVAVSASRSIALNDSGSEVLTRIKNGNTTFVSAATPGNSGTGIISPGSVTNSTAITGHDYSITFTVSAGVTTYSVTDTTSATTVVSNAPYVPGGQIAFDGLQVEIDGAPANADSYSVQPSANVSVFATLDTLRTALRSAGTGAVENANLTNSLNTVHSNLQNALDRVLAVTTSVGARLRETETIVSSNQDLDLNYDTRLSELRDLDYARALSDLSYQQLQLEAAQKSFVLVAGLSLFGLL
jgi:flagellar hook-associated protein 3 FlgL